eukprot:TRINITY_DN2429_c0_g6_i1.p1 TRINITY_DN2429_c0_g6~~TRINITY_DN2429_c0_g6_i1.p1  ORF type:complete len:317 (-),score=90.49 TRINITY_DN2429_c0_g6_i1:107-1057(-)
MRIFFLGTNAGIASASRACQCYAVVCDDAENTAQERDKAHCKSESPVFLIDCGTGSYRQLIDPKCIFQSAQIHTILITHMHGDHVGGLLEILSSDYFGDRVAPLYIYGPAGLDSFLQMTFEFMKVDLRFPLIIQEIHLPHPEGHPDLQRSPKDKLLHPVQDLSFPHSNISIHAFPLYHSITSQGYLFIQTDAKTGAKKTLVLLGDTANSDSLVIAKESHDVPPVDVLVHESTFGEEMRQCAISRGHSTNIMALEFAQKINAKALILFHFSSRYPEAHKSEKSKLRNPSIEDIVQQTAEKAEGIQVIKSYDFYEFSL